MKRLLSMLLAITLLVTIIPANAFAQNAQPTTSTESQVDQATVNNENMTVTGTNHIGDMLSKNIQQEQASNVEALQTGYDVVSLTVENNKATVEYYAKDEASLVVAIYDNDRTQLLSSSTVDVTADEEKVTLELPDTLPEYFHASAYLVSPKDQKPLCTALHTSMYTKEIQELLQSTVDDYNPNLVLNLDQRNDTNFAVYNEDTVVAPEQSGVNTVISVDDENLTYVIGNPSQEIRSLMYGDVLSLPYGDEDILFVKVDRVSVSGNTATITGLPIEMQDVFSHVKIDGDADLEDAQVDTETADEGVTFEGIIEEPATRAVEGGSSASCTLTYKFFKNIKEGSEGKYGEASLQVNGLFSLKVSIGVKYYIAWYKQEFKFTVDAEGSFVVGYEGTAKLTIPLGKVNIPAFAGINVGFEPKLILELKGKMETVISITSKFGISFVPGEGIKNISEPPKASASLKAEATIFAGFDLEPNVNIIDPSVAKVSLSVPIGAELTAKMTGTSVEGMASVRQNNHGCIACVAIGLDVKFGISASVTFLNKKWLTWGFNIIELKKHLLDGYYSIDHDEFAWTKCPHKAYPVTITVLNSDGQPMKDVSVRYVPEANPFFQRTDAEGKTRSFLPPGDYTLTATKGDYAGSSTVTVEKDTNATIKVLLTGDVTESIKWSLTEAGGLSIFGTGAIPSYAASSQLPWNAYISKVKSISVSDGITGIGANVFRDHTNAKSVSIGKTVSSIDLSAFEGLNLSSFTVSNANSYYAADPKGVLYNKDKTTLYKALLPLTLTYDVSNTVTNVASKAFVGQTGITLIHFPGNAPTIASDAFSGMNAEALYCTRTSGWTQDKLQQYGGTIAWSSYDGLLGSGTFGDQFTWQVYNDGVLRISGIGEMTNYTSASKTPWYKYRGNIKTVVLSNGITAIGDYAFAECTALETITIPATANRIGKYAFYNCSSLADISIPQAVSAISTYTFYNCSSLTEISLPEGVAAIESYAFYGCSKLQSINIPERVTVIADYTFYDCSSLQEVPLHDEITTIGEYAFYNCTGFRELVIPNSITQIGKYAFANCSSVLNLRIRENYDPDFTGLTIDTYAFQNCTSLRVAKLPDSTVQINESIFSGCGSLESISIPFVVGRFGYIFGTSNYTGAMKVLQRYRDGDVGTTYYIPSSLKTVIVTGGEIFDFAFINCTKLETVVLQGAITAIGYKSFEYCSGLQSVTIPDSVTSIGQYAFEGCTSLTSVNFSENSRLITVGSCAFWRCSGLTGIIIPDSVTTIGSSAFSSGNSLTSVTFGENSQLTSIGGSAFSGCNRLTSITIPDSVTSIGDYAFDNCTSLTSVTFEDNSQLTSISNSMFSGCSSLANIIFGDNSQLTSIPDNMFQCCDSLTSLTFGDNCWLTTIGAFAFEDCGNLRSITFGKNSQLTTIGGYAFRRCSSLTDITIPDSVTSIGPLAFYDCSNLTSVTLGIGIREIGSDTFFNCSKLTQVNIPDASAWCYITFKSKYANPVYYAENLYVDGVLVSEVNVPEDITKISDYAFYYCTSLTSITIPDSVTSIGNDAFYNCSALNCNIYDNAKYLGNSKNPYMVLVSSASTGITSCTIHDDAKFIHSRAFYNCTSLTSITIPASVTSIGYSAFYRCTSLTSITIPDSVTSIGDSAFNNCEKLTSVTFDENSQLASIGDSAFRSCSGLTGITIPNSVQSIGDTAFYVCSSLTSINIPDSVTSIGYSAFSRCSSLTRITFQGNAPTINSYAFEGVTATAYYPSGNSTWTSSVRQNYGGTITWKASTATRSISYSGTTEPETKADATLESFEPDRKSSTLSGNTKKRTVTFEDLDPGEEYIFLSLVSENEENPLIYENLLFIDQLCADENGTITVSYRPRFASDSVCELVRGGAVKNLAEATVTWPAYTENGAQQFFVPTVSYNAEALKENVDYVLEGETSFSAPGTYQCYVVGIGDYIGSYSCAYTVAEKYSEGLSYTLSSDGKSYGVSGMGTCTDTEIIIPTKYNDLPVTSIGASAFSGCSSLTSITIPYGVTGIGASAFWGCSSLTSITIRSSVTSIGNSAFSGCSSLRDVYYNGTAARWAQISIGDDNNQLTNATLHTVEPALIKITITKLPIKTEYVIGESLDITGLKLMATYSDGSTQTIIGDYAVSGFDSTTVGTKTLTVTYNEKTATFNVVVLLGGTCGDNLIWTLDDAGTLTISSNGATADYNIASNSAPWISQVDSIKSVIINNGITSIGDSAFNYCTSLTSITIPDSVTSIGNYAFSYCVSLTSITIPDSVTSIGNYAFSYCVSLTSITIPGSVTNIGDFAFNYCGQLTRVSFGENSQLTSIGNYAFSYCRGLTSITIPDSVTSIGNYAFSYCGSLTSITIPGSVTNIGDFAFNYCGQLTRVSFGENSQLTSIGDYAFNSCFNLTSITIPDTVTTIGMCAFTYCQSLTRINIPESVTSIGSGAFSCCEIKKMVLASAAVTNAVIRDCMYTLSEVVILDSVTSISEFKFSNFAKLQKIYFQGNAPSIGESAFSKDTVTVYYPANDATWTSDVMQTYGATSIQWVAAVATVHSADGMEGMYGTLAEAIAACQPDQRIVLITDVAETISVDKDLHIDLNGNTLEGLTVEGTLYCIDSTASAITAGTGVAKVTGIVAQDHTVDGVRYIALGSDGSYTFHALQLKLSFVTFRVNAAGIYYKAEVVCDPVLQAAIDSYGVALSLHSMPGTDFVNNADVEYTQISGVPTIRETFSSGSVFGIFKDGQDNAQRGQEKIYANAYIKLKDGTCLMSDQTTGDQVTDQDFDGVAWSLRDVLTHLNSTFNQLEVKQQTLLKEFCTTWKDAVSGWNLSNILKEN